MKREQEAHETRKAEEEVHKLSKDDAHVEKVSACFRWSYYSPTDFWKVVTRDLETGHRVNSMNFAMTQKPPRMLRHERFENQ